MAISGYIIHYLNKISQSNFYIGRDASSFQSSAQHYFIVIHFSRRYFWFQFTFGIFYGILMVDQSLICFKIQMKMDDWSFTINKYIAIDGENIHDQFHYWYGDENHVS